MPAPPYYTADRVRRLTDPDRHWPRYETVHGELLVTAAPRMWHQEIVGRLLVALRSYLAREPVAHAFSSPSDISWGEDTLVQPDVFVLPLDQARTLDWAQAKTLLLAIEVLSPSSLRADHVIKRRLYQEHGVPEYWVVDADRKIVDIWTPRAFFPRSEKHQLVWHPSAARSPLTIPLNDLFQPI